MKKVDIDVAGMVKEKEKILQQIFLPLGYSEDRIMGMVNSYRQGILDTLEKLKSHETIKNT